MDQFWSSYRYTTNPINSVDPNGMFEVDNDMVITKVDNDPTGYCPDGQPFGTLLDPTTALSEGMLISTEMNLNSVTNDILQNLLFRWFYAAKESPKGKMDFTTNDKLPVADLYLINNKVYDLFEAGNYAWGSAMNKLGFSYPSVWAGSNIFGSVRANFGAWGFSFGDNKYDQQAIKGGYNAKQ
jgi:hypothetical protein